MDLTQIRYFVALAETLNFTRAAESCNVTQPALTKSIQKLEDELGGPLLLRERAHSQLTELGRAMLPLLRHTYDAARAAALGAAQFHKQDTAQLRLGLGHWVPPASLEPLLCELGQRFPGLEVSLREADGPTLNEWLINAEIDAAFTVEAETLTTRANHWMLFDEDVVALVHASHPMAGSAAMPDDELCGQAVVGRHAPCAPPRTLQDVGPAPRYKASTEQQVWTLLRVGAGVALSTAQRSVPADIVGRRLHPPRAIAVHIAAIPGRRATRAVDAFVKLARARAWAAQAPAPRSMVDGAARLG